MSEPTFRSYTAEQTRTYALQRGTSYPAELYQEILRYHEQKGGQWRCFVDIGCGPGRSTHDLAHFFDRAVGVDHSPEMVQHATSQSFQAKSGSVQFYVSDAESFDQLPDLESGSVDLITAGMAVHWFDMQKFWQAAANALAPGGTVALWTCSSLYCHPNTPNAARVQEIMFDLENNVLGKYALPGNLISQGMYEDLQMPWQVSPQVEAFHENDLRRREWNRDGRLENDESDFFIGYSTSVNKMRNGISSASMYTRWAAANPHLAGTEEDCVKVQARRIQEATQLGDDDELKVGTAVVLLLFKRS